MNLKVIIQHRLHDSGLENAVRELLDITQPKLFVDPKLYSLLQGLLKACHLRPFYLSHHELFCSYVKGVSTKKLTLQ